MMADNTMTCDICFNDFNEFVFIPKVLNCGHTFGFLCIMNLIASSQLCPKCRRGLRKDKPGSEYPTNYSILEAVVLLNNREQSSPMISIQIRNRIEGMIGCLKTKKSEISSNLDQICVELYKRQSLIDPQKEILDLDQATKILNPLEIKYKGDQDDPLQILRDLRRSVNIDIDNYESCDKYLIEIYNKLRRKEKIYLVKVVNFVVKYGEVSVDGNMILFHALSETEKPEDSSLIWFDDLKQCLVDKNIFTFLKLCCNEDEVVRLVTIEMFDVNGAIKFAKLCTGECGTSYKGQYYNEFENKALSIGILKSYYTNRNKSNVDRPTDYILKTKPKNDKVGRKDHMYVSIVGQGFNIYKLVTDFSFINTVGKVESPPNLDQLISFRDESKSKIMDCGILFKL